MFGNTSLSRPAHAESGPAGRAKSRHYMLVFAAGRSQHRAGIAHVCSLFVRRRDRPVESHNILDTEHDDAQPMRRARPRREPQSEGFLEWAKSVGSRVTMWGVQVKRSFTTWPWPRGKVEHHAVGHVVVTRGTGKNRVQLHHAVSGLDTTQPTWRRMAAGTKPASWWSTISGVHHPSQESTDELIELFEANPGGIRFATSRAPGCDANGSRGEKGDRPVQSEVQAVREPPGVLRAPRETSSHDGLMPRYLCGGLPPLQPPPRSLPDRPTRTVIPTTGWRAGIPRVKSDGRSAPRSRWAGETPGRCRNRWG